MNDEREEQRIRGAYDRRAANDPGGTYTWMNPATAFHLQRQEQELLGLLRRHGFTDLSASEILEVGCGGGSELRNFIKYGAEPAHLHGVDIIADRIEQGRALSPNVDFRHLNAAALPFPDHSFDIVYQFVMFTSILDDSMKSRIAAEMMRVVKPAGLIIWYDYFVSRPGNRDVRGIRRGEIASLFPGWYVDIRKVTLAAPLGRAVATRSLLAASLLEKIPFLKSHYLAAISQGK